ncbi:hypothetical protein BATDEDRAFT_86414 [Batrachochytrium dendrobatidis JAM81]|uniref:Phosphate-induced protein 1 conserved region-domain-containing protein n=1 Tax=Batrachochytrium dendrobatidis (strain JAM81 / FGSC 10211) TaxID=684364 RepID=F4NWG8_BATDJ|nr:uncharacterized protein BATDEDRAFT_86414 [Batrachochytrium dendrobatidis JAM81]EGF82828.1 hypothetical protein BATDEDRAFT_86414 [Batrachochytrium dendrobatidis JAM81]KAJ8328048.1 hypothetical protein O5D80_003430 [Batrachochytrium dendrobatidis]KAK5667009.1 hypothetical protein QVD99_006227 [Batrachochytrium dendrobatidis]|eukprot:XP_006677069.1 hypothetical protein BATDEDRAFT_86414 [Batrachochytrium dendrobatidis JAM81]
MIATTLLVASLAVAGSIAAPAAPHKISISPMHGKHHFATAGDTITYNMGAPLLTGPLNVYFIYYGTWSAEQKQIVKDFTSGLGTSDWWTTEKKYYYQQSSSSSKVYIDGQVNYAGSVDDNYSVGKSLSGTAIPDLVSKYISAGTFPEDTNAVYYMLIADDVTENALGSSFCSGYCGYHTSANDANGKEIYYALSGRPNSSCISGCAPPTNVDFSPNSDVPTDAMLSVMAHELAEAASDPSNNRAWNDASGAENGDMCAYTYGATKGESNGSSSNCGWNGRNFMIQQNWDPETQSCTMGSGGSGPNPNPNPNPSPATTDVPPATTDVPPATTTSAPQVTGSCDPTNFCCIYYGYDC